MTFHQLVRLRPRLKCTSSWKTKVILFLIVVAISLQTVNITLSWWIQVSSLMKHESMLDSPSIHHKVADELPEAMKQILQRSILDGSGEFKFSVGFIQGRRRSSNTLINISGRNISYSGGVDLSLATHCSLARLHLIPELAKRWNGPLSVAVFLLNEEVHAGVQLMFMLRRCFPEIEMNTTFSVVYPLRPAQSLHDLSIPRSTSSCDEVLSTFALYERPNYDFQGTPYPNNLLRNVAQRAIESEYVLVLDVDLFPSKDLHSKFLDFIKEDSFGKASVKSEEQDRTVWVVPSYEIKEGASVPESKASLLRLRRAQMARPFYQELCWKCQKYTDYFTWEKHEDTKLRPLYEVLWRDPWEPFYISRTTIPSYDERFRQYGFNRISQVCELHIAGYKFVVLSSAFVVHKGFKSPLQFHPKKEEELGRNRILFRQFKENLKNKYPESPRRCY